MSHWIGTPLSLAGYESEITPCSSIPGCSVLHRAKDGFLSLCLFINSIRKKSFKLIINNCDLNGMMIKKEM